MDAFISAHDEPRIPAWYLKVSEVIKILAKTNIMSYNSIVIATGYCNTITGGLNLMSFKKLQKVGVDVW